MVSIPCSSCNLPSIIDEEGKCYFCNPTNTLKYLHAKELKVKEYLDDNDIHYTQHDKVIDGGKFGKERPDFLFDQGTHCVILEVDENQHAERPCECEQTRMVNISQSLGKPTIFIRYNPDNYKKPKNVKRTPNEDHYARMEITASILNKYLSTPPEVFLSVTQLFFDDWNGEHQLLTILEFETSEYINVNDLDEEDFDTIDKPIIKRKPKVVVNRKTQVTRHREETDEETVTYRRQTPILPSPVRPKPKVVVNRKTSNIYKDERESEDTTLTVTYERTPIHQTSPISTRNGISGRRKIVVNNKTK
jgi:hypothetical protein